MLMLQGPDHPVEALTFSPDATTLYAVQGHHGIRTWNITDRTATRAECEGQLLVEQFVFHPGGRWAFSATAHTTSPTYNTARIIDLSTGTMRPFNFTGNVRDNIACLPDGSRLITIGSTAFEPGRLTPAYRARTRLYGWTMTATGPEQAWHYIVPAREIMRFVVALDRQFAIAEMTALPGYTYDNPMWSIRLTICRATTGACVTELAYPHQQIQQLLASPTGELLVARDGTELHVWTALNWSAPPVVVAGAHDHAMEPSAACFHPSGRYLLLANNNPSVTAFDTSTWAPVQTWRWDAGALRSTAVSPDGSLAAAGSSRGVVVVWDLDL